MFDKNDLDDTYYNSKKGKPKTNIDNNSKNYSNKSNPYNGARNFYKMNDSFEKNPYESEYNSFDGNLEKSKERFNNNQKYNANSFNKSNQHNSYHQINEDGVYETMGNNKNSQNYFEPNSPYNNEKNQRNQNNNSYGNNGQYTTMGNKDNNRNLNSNRRYENQIPENDVNPYKQTSRTVNNPYEKEKQDKFGNINNIQKNEYDSKREGFQRRDVNYTNNNDRNQDYYNNNNYERNSRFEPKNESFANNNINESRQNNFRDRNDNSRDESYKSERYDSRNNSFKNRNDIDVRKNEDFYQKNNRENNPYNEKYENNRNVDYRENQQKYNDVPNNYRETRNNFNKNDFNNYEDERFLQSTNKNTKNRNEYNDNDYIKNKNSSYDDQNDKLKNISYNSKNKKTNKKVDEKKKRSNKESGQFGMDEEYNGRESKKNEQDEILTEESGSSYIFVASVLQLLIIGVVFAVIYSNVLGNDEQQTKFTYAVIIAGAVVVSCVVWGSVIEKRLTDKRIKLMALESENKPVIQNDPNWNINNEETIVLFEEDGITPFLEVKIDGAVKKYPIDKDIVLIGRQQSNVDFYIPSNSIGRVHAQISVKNNRYFIRDLESKNGTLINGRRISPNRDYPIHNNDILSLADLEVNFWTP